MADPFANAPAPAPGSPGPGPGAVPDSLLQQLSALWRELPGLVSDRVELLSLELQRASRALFEIVVLLVVMAVLGVTVWLALWAALVGLLMSAGLPPLVALLLTIAINGVAVVLVLQRVRRLLPRLRLPATRRHLMVSPNPQPGPAAQDRSDDATAVAPARQPVSP